jgi:predicted porin
MKKKLIALAVASAIAAPATVLADAILYGKAHVSLDYYDMRNETLVTETNGELSRAVDGDTVLTRENGNPVLRSNGFKGWSMSNGMRGDGFAGLPRGGSSRASRVGVRGSEDLGGLKGIYQVEFGVPLANENDDDISNGETGGVKMRNSYVGVQGGFGTILAGRHDTPFKMSIAKLDLFEDTMADFNGTIGFDDVRADSTVAYISPNWSGIQLSAATIPGGEDTVNGDNNPDSHSINEGYSLGATYSNGPWYAGAGFEAMSEDLNDATGTSPDTEDYKKWHLGVGIRDLSGFYLSAIYEKQQAQGFTKGNDAKLMQGQVGYAFGNNMFKAMYGVRYFNKPATGTRNPAHKSWGVGFDHNFSKRTKAYLLYTKFDADEFAHSSGHTDDRYDWEGVSLGMIHNF